MKEKDGICPRLGALSYQNNLSSTDRQPFSEAKHWALGAFVRQGEYVIVSGLTVWATAPPAVDVGLIRGGGDQSDDREDESVR